MNPWNKGIRMKTKYFCSNLVCPITYVEHYNNDGKPPKYNINCPLCKIEMIKQE